MAFPFNARSASAPRRNRHGLLAQQTLVVVWK
jgi:hypothetical protein